MTIVACFLLLLSAYVTLCNIGGCVQAHRRQKRGESGGYSNVPILSFVFASLAWLAGHNLLGFWVFVPTVLDPGTWVIVLLPFLFLARSHK